MSMSKELEIYGTESWRVLPVDAKLSDKFRADMILLGIGEFPAEMNGGSYARGRIFNDSRGIFLDGEVVRTSTIKDQFELNGVRYIETRNTLYKLI